MRKLVFMVAMSAALVGCGNPVIPTSASSTADKPSATDARKPVPEFEVTKLDGGSVKAADLKGKVTVLDFWATWCEPCKEEIPDYNKLVEKYAGKDFQVLGVTMESGTPAEIKQKVQEFKIAYPVTVGDDKVVDLFGGLLGFPTTFLISKDGKIQKKFIGSIPGKQKQLTAGIDALLNTPPQSGQPGSKESGPVTQLEPSNNRNNRNGWFYSGSFTEKSRNFEKNSPNRTATTPRYSRPVAACV